MQQDFLDNTLNQLREWRPMPGGKNGLRFDDCGNVVSMVSDPAIRRLAPKWPRVHLVAIPIRSIRARIES